MRYGKRKNPIDFGGGQSSSEVTSVQTLQAFMNTYLICIGIFSVLLNHACTTFIQPVKRGVQQPPFYA